MPKLAVRDGVDEAIAAFRLPEKLGFGLVPAPVMYSAEFRDGAWGRGELLPYGPIEIHPGARALQYAEQVFEGMKAYRVERNDANLFRPDANWKRLARSAERLGMPCVPQEMFLEGICAVSCLCQQFIPQRSGTALYLRPFIFGTETGYTVHNSRSFRFLVIANPSEIYAAGALKVTIERDDIRAAKGGTGYAKTGANYAASLRASSQAIESGYTVALWLDAETREKVEELSGMNLFVVVDGELHTPALTDSILPGVTRDSLIGLARHRGYRVVERTIPIAELLEQIGDGRCSEVFACGTGAIVSPIAVLRDKDGRTYEPKDVDKIAKELREELLAIQERRAEDPFGWIVPVPATLDAVTG